MSRNKTPWVVAGGKIGEIGHCTHCGRGLNLGGPQNLSVAIAAMNAFVKIHKNCREGMHVEPEVNSPEQWLDGRDTGTSSLTIYAVMMNTPSPHKRYDIPHDPDDFGRCYRLLQLFPKWKIRMDEVGKRFPEWKPFLDVWGQLTVMYEDAIKSNAKAAPEMYELMQKLRRAAA